MSITESSRQRRERKLEQRTKRHADVDGQPLIHVIDGHIFVECPEPANSLELYNHADPHEDEAGRREILCEGCEEKKEAKIYIRFVCADCGEVSWYVQVDGGTIQ